jgi:DNA-directed RNA polymerase specialized sigma24 family protein
MDLEMVKKGCTRYMRMYPLHARDIFQSGCVGCAIGQSRGADGGALMLFITGECKDYLQRELGKHNPPREYGMIPDMVLDCSQQEQNERKELVEDILSIAAHDETDRAILLMIMQGYIYSEIAKTLDRSVIGIKKRLEKIRERAAKCASLL